MIDLQQRRAMVMGVANDRSIAWGIAESLSRAGAEIALSYLPDERGRAQRRAEKLAESIGSKLVIGCDVTEDEQVESMFGQIRKQWESLDILVHSIAWAHVEDLRGGISKTPRDHFAAANDASVYSFIAVCRHASRLMEGRSGSMVTVTYLGSQRAMPSYNIMGVAKAGLESAVRYLAAELGPAGIRVNAVSPGPVETLASAAFPDFDRMLRASAERTPLRRNVTTDEVGDVVAFLCSDLARGITGQVVYVDAGYNIT
jgi:enoyl-[acyl-carrier protein] reductase I